MLIEEFIKIRPRDIPDFYRSPTCPDLERGFNTVFSSDKPADSALYQARLTGLKKWLPDQEDGDPIIGVVKNPEGRNKNLGNRNAIVCVNGILFAAEFSTKGFEITRPVRGLYQDLFKPIISNLVQNTSESRLIILHQ